MADIFLRCGVLDAGSKNIFFKMLNGDDISYTKKHRTYHMVRNVLGLKEK